MLVSFVLKVSKMIKATAVKLIFDTVLEINFPDSTIQPHFSTVGQILFWPGISRI